jgi:hypothetical protein
MANEGSDAKSLTTACPPRNATSLWVDDDHALRAGAASAGSPSNLYPMPSQHRRRIDAPARLSELQAQLDQPIADELPARGCRVQDAPAMVVSFGFACRITRGVEVIKGADARGERQTRIECGRADPELRGHAVAMVVGHVALIDPTRADAEVRGDRVPVVERPGERLRVAAARGDAATENG